MMRDEKSDHWWFYETFIWSFRLNEQTPLPNLTSHHLASPHLTLSQSPPYHRHHPPTIGLPPLSQLHHSKAGIPGYISSRCGCCSQFSESELAKVKVKIESEERHGSSSTNGCWWIRSSSTSVSSLLSCSFSVFHEGNQQQRRQRWRRQPPCSPPPQPTCSPPPQPTSLQLLPFYAVFDRIPGKAFFVCLFVRLSPNKLWDSFCLICFSSSVSKSVRQRNDSIVFFFFRQETNVRRWVAKSVGRRWNSIGESGSESSIGIRI